ncbi:DUF7551 domain-containing protein [Halopiger xanaduensis]|uniref:Uncharacterized protein n=1 Tax=Halopiger xanaduensis (strain DSM 18323 / JCM 14033 / SH-6) TaxID=797210 RepID=F8D2Z2_HALXS|nr:hypothetical protein [Halopiger xanaduensis]AEH36141.1 hypothetical protein Halxa_1509 [Halopiger xanaduensis SH-6]
MVGTTLREIRDRIEQIASEDGEFYVVCARSGERPVPVAGKRFPTREAAVDAVRATEQYRAALRRYDPQLPFYDPVVCQVGRDAAADPAPPAPSAADPVDDRPSSRSTDAIDSGRQPLIGFCHDVSGAVFEALSARDHAAAESAIMDAYLAAAEAVADPDTLCLVLLESMATELERHLAPDERVGVLEAAARNLLPVQAAGVEDPVEASLEHLHSLSLISEYGVVRRPLDADGGNAWVVYLRGYAMESSERRFPTLPIGIDLLRRTAEVGVDGETEPGRHASLGVSEANALGDDDWRLVLTTDAAADGLICVEEGGEP